MIGENGKVIMLVNQNKDTYARKTDEYIVAYIDLLGVTNKIQSKDSQLAKINYRIHTDAIKVNLIPPELTPQQTSVIYASEADVLNMALFGMTTKQ